MAKRELGAAPSLPQHGLRLADVRNADGTQSAPLLLTPQQAVVYARGLLYYDADNESLTFHNNDSAVAMQLGQEVWARVRNVTGATIPNGTPVYITGSDSGWPTIAPARADAVNTATVLGLTTEAIPNGTIGYVSTIGLVRGVDTSAYTAGAQVYLSATTAGALTATPPAAPNFWVPLGRVATVSASTGMVSVSPTRPVIANPVGGDGSILQAVKITQTAYNALGSGRPSTTFYVISG